MEDQIEELRALARGYMMMAMAMRQAGYEESCQAYLKSEAQCFNKMLEIEEKLEEINNYMMAA